MTINFEEVWNAYPSKIGKKAAERHFKATVKTEEKFKLIKIALDNYISSKRVVDGFIQNGSTWFNDWECWVDAPSGKSKEVKELEELFSEKKNVSHKFA